MPGHNQFILDQNRNLSPALLRTVGAYFPIEIHVPPQIASSLTQAGRPVPAPVAGLGLIDTGATFTCANETILTGLGLQPVGTVNSGTANGQVTQNLYPARIVFPTKGWQVDLTSVAGVNLVGQFIPEDPPKPIIALLGRNLLEHWILIYNGPGGFWTVAV